MNEKVVYFSLCQNRKASFYQYIKDESFCYEPKFSFALEGEKDEFNDPRDLITLIERNQKKDSLHIIIDYVSCCGTGKETNYATAIRDIIMCYPEVQFLFDETFVRKSKDERNKGYNFLNFLFWKAETDKDSVIGNVFAAFHQFDLGDFDKNAVKKQFVRLLKGCNNMFDASNLRYAIKRIKFRKLDVKRNYEKLEESRKSHAAVVVEEEYHQNMFNSYCLYANGYRVFPVVSATELKWINEESWNRYLFSQGVERFKQKGESPLLIRDYDLQFVDENIVDSGVEKGQITIKGNPKPIGLNEIDYIRGAKAVEYEDEHGSKIIRYKLVEKDAKGNPNPYWKVFQKDKVYFVSKGGGGVEIKLGKGKAMEVKISQSSKGKVSDKLVLNGLKKPLEGIYISVKRIEDIDTRYNESQDDLPFVISRQGGTGHSCPLDIYGIARSMVHRAEDHYKNGRNRLAALVAGEALEVLNGFHRSLMNKAYHIQAVSENAMAMSLLGGDEGVLKKDIKFRLKRKVIKDAKRMIPDDKDRFNLLYNIFNDCMLFCREKEYFEAADEALSVMVYEKEGMSPKGLFKLKDTMLKKLEQSEFLKKLMKSRVMTNPLMKWLRYRVLPHAYSFWLPWVLLVAMLAVAIFMPVSWKLLGLSLLLIFFVIALVFLSMNVIHGLIGTRGDIKTFFGMFFVINVMFYLIYYDGFFKNAGITYDTDQPHVEFNIFEGCGKKATAVMIEKGKKLQFDKDGKPIDKCGKPMILIQPNQKEEAIKKTKVSGYEHFPANASDKSHYYHRIRNVWVMQNTLLTSLMQEPTEFYSFACTYNGDYHREDHNFKIANAFHWFLVFHILISWIFLGVFISLIYQKFRNN